MRSEQVVRDALRRDALFLRQVGRAPHVGRAACGRAAGGDAPRGVAPGLVAADAARAARFARAGEAPVGGRARAARASAVERQRDSSPMSSPAKVTDSASRLSRLPSQTGHTLPAMKRATRFFISALCVVAKVCST